MVKDANIDVEAENENRTAKQVFVLRRSILGRFRNLLRTRPPYAVLFVLLKTVLVGIDSNLLGQSGNFRGFECVRCEVAKFYLPSSGEHKS